MRTPQDRRRRARDPARPAGRAGDPPVIGDGRPRYAGQGPEPLFFTDDGLGFSEGWHTMHQRLRRSLERRGISGYKQHRNRNTWNARRPRPSDEHMDRGNCCVI